MDFCSHYLNSNAASIRSRQFRRQYSSLQMIRNGLPEKL